MARRTVDEAKIVLGMDATKFMSTMNKTIAKLKSLSAATLKVTAGFAAFGAAAVTAGVAGAAVLVSKSLEAIDKIGKLSTRLGIATETLGRFKLIASLSGIEFNQFAIAIQRAERRTADAAAGNQGLNKSFRELGLSARQLQRMSPEERFFAISDALNKVEDSSERVRLAFALFDSEGVAVLQAVNQGTDALRAMAKEADELGLTMDAKTVRGVERANDAITRLKNLFIGVRDQLTAALAPALERLADLFKGKLLEAIKNNGGSVKVWARNVVLDVLKMVGEVTLAIETFAVKSLQVIAKIRSRFGMSVEGFEEAQQSMLEFFGGIIDQIVAMGVAVRNNMSVAGIGEEGGNTSGMFGGDDGESARRQGRSLTESFKEGALAAGQSIRDSFDNLALDVRKPIKSIGQSIENTFIGAANKIFSEVVGNILSGIAERFLTNIGLGAILGFASGGYTGNKPTNQVAGVTHGQEFVVKASATKRWRGLLESINNGGVPNLGVGNVQAPRMAMTSPTVIQENHYHFDGTYNPAIRASWQNDIAQASPAIQAATIQALTRGA